MTNLMNWRLSEVRRKNARIEDRQLFDYRQMSFRTFRPDPVIPERRPDPTVTLPRVKWLERPDP